MNKKDQHRRSVETLGLSGHDAKQRGTSTKLSAASISIPAINKLDSNLELAIGLMRQWLNEDRNR